MKSALKTKIISTIKIFFNPKNWVKGMIFFVRHIPEGLHLLIGFSTFFILLSIFLIEKTYQFLEHIFILGKIFTFLRPKFEKICAKPATLIVTKLESVRPFQVKQSYLIRIAFQSLQIRISRTLVTIFGMAAGVGIIVYLLSLGYGIEKLVISQVASLDELKIIDVSASQNTALKMNDETIKKIKKIQNIEGVHSLISLVGRITYNKAQADVLVFAADDKYLTLINPTMRKGKLFVDNGGGLRKKTDTSKNQNESVAGVSIIDGSYMKPRSVTIYSVNILPQKDAPIRETCDVQSNIIGYVPRLDAPLLGYAMWGGTYYPYAQGGRTGYDQKKDMYLGNWVTLKAPLFFHDADNVLRPIIGEDGHQVWSIGCTEEKYVDKEEAPYESAIKSEIFGEMFADMGEVLGESTASASLEDDEEESSDTSTSSASLMSALSEIGVEATGEAESAYSSLVISTDSAGVEYVSLESSESKESKTNDIIKFEEIPLGHAVISTGLMKILGISEDKIIGKKFKVSFIVTKALIPGLEGRAFSEERDYEVVGLISDDDQQYFYIPLSDMKKLGVTNYSQLKLFVNDKKNVPKARVQIETFGYNTASAGDTVAQIESLFANIRLVLGLIGLVALAVASLGMFNTMTVSLLERTREIGGMKVIGMVSREIRDLFLAEAMIMGFSGGVGGLIFGYILGQITSFLVSIISVTQGLGYLHLTSIPLPFTISILILSFAVGILTGLYPAYRAKNISALNALRYE